MRGRKPLPTEVKRLRGNPGHYPLNENEPKHADLEHDVPEELTDPKARKEWERVVSTLSNGHVTIVDRATLIGYCEKYAQWRTLEAEASRHPMLIKSPNGFPVPNPALGMANTAYKLMLKSAVELGITPSSRSRIVVAPRTDANATDEFTRYQRKRLALKL